MPKSLTAHVPASLVASGVVVVVSSATPTPEDVGGKHSRYHLTALAVNAVFAAPSGSPLDGDSIVIRIKDNGTARTLGWNAIYRAFGDALPTTTVAGKTMYVGINYNATDARWDVIAVNREV